MDPASFSKDEADDVLDDGLGFGDDAGEREEDQYTCGHERNSERKRCQATGGESGRHRPSVS